MKLVKLGCALLFSFIFGINQKGEAQNHKRICVIGSSTAWGYFENPPLYPRDSGWTFKLQKYYKAAGILDTLYNLAVVGDDCYNGMPSSFIAPSGRNAFDPGHNITAAINQLPKPDIIIVNYPTNSYDYLSEAEVLQCLQTIKDSANAQNIQCYISTTQPRNTFSPSEQQKLEDLQGLIKTQFGQWAIDFWTGIAMPDSPYVINPIYSLGDGVHLTPSGQTVLEQRVIAKNIFGNQVPVANAGSDQVITLPANSVTLSGSGTDADGTINSYLWEKASGPSAGTITNTSSATTTVTSIVAGVYQFVLTVTDNSGATNSDTTQVIVKGINIPPVANAGTDQVITLPTNSVTLSGSGTDADGTIASYLWAKASGPSSGTITNASSATTTVTPLVVGVYQFVLTVTDNSGTKSSDTMQVTVKAANIPPIANAGVDQTITLPTSSITLSGSGTDADGTIASYLWAKASGPSSGIVTNTGSATTTVTALVAGVYQFVLTVTDNSGAKSSDTMQVTVKAGNIPPVANAGADQVIALPTTSTTLTGSGTDADGTIKSYKWVEISGPSTGKISSSTSASTKVSSLTSGVYLFSLTVTDNGGATGADTVKVTVNAVNTPPIAHAGADQTIALPATTATLSGSGTDVDGTISSYKWAKVSGPSSGKITSSSSATTTVTALVAGVYTFSLTVTDNNSATGKDTIQITVTAVNKPPVANAGADQTITLPINSVTLSGSGTDADGTIASYLWAKVSGPSSGTIASTASATTTVSPLIVGVYLFSLTVTDNSGGKNTDTMQVTVKAANIPPVSNAGADQTITLPINNVTLNGSGTDADGKIASYLWAKVSGPSSGTIASASSATTTVSPLVTGVYLFSLAVTDNNGAKSTDTMQVTVKAANIPPVANAGPDQTITLPINSVTLSGSGTDADGTIASYLWAKISGPSSGTIASASSATTTVSPLVSGVYLFVLTVTDNGGLTNSDTIQVTVNAASTNSSSDTTNVNIYGGTNPYTNAAWNNWNVGTGEATNITSSALTNTIGTNSGVTCTFSYVAAIADNGAAYGGTMCPPEVLRYASYTTSNRTLTINNLTAGATYGFQFYSSRGNTGNATTYTINGQSQTVTTDNNKTTVASFTGITPNASNQVIISIARGSASTYQYVNGFTMINTVVQARPSLETSNSLLQNVAKLSLYPNPSRDNVTLHYSGKEQGALTVNIVDVYGKKVQSFSFVKSQSDFHQTINTAKLSGGVYYIEVSVGNNIKSVEKLIKN